VKKLIFIDDAPELLKLQKNEAREILEKDYEIDTAKAGIFFDGFLCDFKGIKYSNDKNVLSEEFKRQLGAFRKNLGRELTNKADCDCIEIVVDASLKEKDDGQEDYSLGFECVRWLLRNKKVRESFDTGVLRITFTTQYINVDLNKYTRHYFPDSKQVKFESCYRPIKNNYPKPPVFIKEQSAALLFRHLVDQRIDGDDPMISELISDLLTKKNIKGNKTSKYGGTTYGNYWGLVFVQLFAEANYE
jgi:hypothetical protein